VTAESGPRALLLDIGDTLTTPIGGRWNPRFDFETVLARHHPDIHPTSLPAAFAAGDRLLTESERTPSRDEYHRVVLGRLGIAAPTDALLSELNRPLPFTEVVHLFDDVHPVLGELGRRGVPMAVVSDGWGRPIPGEPEFSPGAYQNLVDLGLHRYLDVAVYSESLGCTKPDPRMYTAASDRLGRSPAECLFVDDDPELVAAAVALGYHGRVLRRGRRPATSSVPAISSLTELLELFPAAEPPREKGLSRLAEPPAGAGPRTPPG
jgi:putative hydrolase of the HAD superfamily